MRKIWLSCRYLVRSYKVSFRIDNWQSVSPGSTFSCHLSTSLTLSNSTHISFSPTRQLFSFPPPSQRTSTSPYFLRWLGNTIDDSSHSVFSISSTRALETLSRLLPIEFWLCAFFASSLSFLEKYPAFVLLWWSVRWKITSESARRLGWKVN